MKRTVSAALYAILILTALSSSISAQNDIYKAYGRYDAEFNLEDLGRMWTFDNVPLDKFEKEYGFRPSEEWLEEVRLSALQFGGGCSAAFVSGDGLIMTNHHCGRGRLAEIQKDGEDLLKDGFYAGTLEEERKIPNLFVDQLQFIEDVTDEVLEAFNSGSTDAEKVKLKSEKIKELETAYGEETGLTCRVVTLYNGGKFSLYGYKRYSDIRLVMSPDFQIAATGWDWDNFTYPRYELDFAFYRAYDENGEPVKSEHHFGWSKKGADEGEPIFVIGRPGSTQRLITVAQLEYLRDYTYPQLLTLFNGLYFAYSDLYEKYKDTDRQSQLLNSVMGWGNARKSYAGQLMGLRDEYIMAKKKDFEVKLKAAVKADPELKAKYGNLWNDIGNVIDEMKQYSNEAMALRNFRWMRTAYSTASSNIIKFAKQMKLPEDEREDAYKSANLEETKKAIFPDGADLELAGKMLRARVNFLHDVLGEDHELVKALAGNLTGDQAVEFLLSKSKLTSKESAAKFAESDPEEILNSNDPFIFLDQYIAEKSGELSMKMREAGNTLQVLNPQLGEIVFAVYGENISPDATSTLRISDGTIKGYEYNGTIAPGKTTFYGLWDRYESFSGETYPWGLHERWKTPPPELDLSIPIGFASTNDIVGGNSGSSVINKNREVVGLVHDGNLESLPGHFIFLPVNNRTVASDSWGLIESLKYVYKTPKLVEELVEGKLPK